MRRILLAVLCTSGVAIPLVDKTGSPRADDMWNPAESRAALFQSNAATRAAPYFSGTALTIERWVNLAGVLRIGFLRVDEPEPQEPDVVSVRGINDNDEMHCSSHVDPGPSQGNFCSAKVPGSGSVEGEDHTDCTSLFVEAGTLYCSSMPPDHSNVVTCSTQGGQSTGDTDGAVACSAGHADPGGNAGDALSLCSTQGGATSQSCSTFGGEHQACSAGDISNDNDVAMCSASGAPTGNTFCSVLNSPPANKYRNKCTAINTSPTADASHRCSTATTGAGNARCSVLDTATTNAACTVINHGDGTADGAACSAVIGGDNPPNQTTCSVIKPDGTFVSGPINGICGDPNSTGH